MEILVLRCWSEFKFDTVTGPLVWNLMETGPVCYGDDTVIDLLMAGF